MFKTAQKGDNTKDFIYKNDANAWGSGQDCRYLSGYARGG